MHIVFTCCHSFWKLLTDNIDSNSIWSNSWSVLWPSGPICFLKVFSLFNKCYTWQIGFRVSVWAVTLFQCLVVFNLNGIFLKAYFTILQNTRLFLFFKIMLFIHKSDFLYVLIMHEISWNLRSLPIYKIEINQDLIWSSSLYSRYWYVCSIKLICL